MQVELLTKEDLKQFKAELVQELKDAFSGNAKPPNKEWLKSGEVRWLKSGEVRKLLATSPGTLQNLRISGTLAYSKIGGTMYYRYKDILKLLEKGGAK